MDDVLGFLGAEHTNASQHLSVGDRAGDVLRVEPLVKGNRRRECLDKLIGSFRESAPQQARLFWLRCSIGAHDVCTEN